MDRYKVVRQIGKGSFGKVFLVTCTPEGGKRYVLKVVKLRGVPAYEREACRNEVALLRRLDHPSIVGFKESFTTDAGDLAIVMTYCDGGDLSSRIAQHRERAAPMSEDQAMAYFVQVALAVHYMHEQRVLHRDIKAQNAFLLGNGRVMLGDFGISKALGGGGGPGSGAAAAAFARTQIGTPLAMAPEVLGNQRYDWKSDVWAMGCLAYELATGRHPFEAPSLPALAQKVQRGAYAPLGPKASAGLRGLVAALLQTSPAARPTMGDVLRLPYVRRHVQAFLRDTAERAALGLGGVAPGAASAVGGGHGPSSAALPPPPPPQQAVSEGTLLFSAAAARVAAEAASAAGGAPDANALLRATAAGLGPHAQNLYRQLTSLGLADVVTKALAEAAAATASSPSRTPPVAAAAAPATARAPPTQSQPSRAVPAAPAALPPAPHALGGVAGAKPQAVVVAAARGAPPARRDVPAAAAAAGIAPAAAPAAVGAAPPAPLLPSANAARRLVRERKAALAREEERLQAVAQALERLRQERARRVKPQPPPPPPLRGGVGAAPAAADIGGGALCAHPALLEPRPPSARAQAQNQLRPPPVVAWRPAPSSFAAAAAAAAQQAVPSPARMAPPLLAAPPHASVAAGGGRVGGAAAAAADDVVAVHQPALVSRFLAAPAPAPPVSAAVAPARPPPVVAAADARRLELERRHVADLEKWERHQQLLDAATAAPASSSAANAASSLPLRSSVAAGSAASSAPSSAQPSPAAPAAPAAPSAPSSPKGGSSTARLPAPPLPVPLSHAARVAMAAASGGGHSSSVLRRAMSMPPTGGSISSVSGGSAASASLLSPTMTEAAMGPSSDSGVRTPPPPSHQQRLTSGSSSNSGGATSSTPRTPPLDGMRAARQAARQEEEARTFAALANAARRGIEERRRAQVAAREAFTGVGAALAGGLPLPGPVMADVLQRHAGDAKDGVDGGGAHLTPPTSDCGSVVSEASVLGGARSVPHGDVEEDDEAAAAAVAAAVGVAAGNSDDGSADVERKDDDSLAAALALDSDDDDDDDDDDGALPDGLQRADSDGSGSDPDIDRREAELQAELMRASMRCNGIRAVLEAARAGSRQAAAARPPSASDIAAPPPPPTPPTVVGSSRLGGTGALRSARQRFGGAVPMRPRRHALRASMLLRLAVPSLGAGSRVGVGIDDRPIRPSLQPHRFGGSGGVDAVTEEASDAAAEAADAAVDGDGALAAESRSPAVGVGAVGTDRRLLLAPSALAKLRMAGRHTCGSGSGGGISGTGGTLPRVGGSDCPAADSAAPAVITDTARPAATSPAALTDATTVASAEVLAIAPHAAAAVDVVDPPPPTAVLQRWPPPRATGECAADGVSQEDNGSDYDSYGDGVDNTLAELGSDDECSDGSDADGAASPGGSVGSGVALDFKPNLLAMPPPPLQSTREPHATNTGAAAVLSLLQRAPQPPARATSSVAGLAPSARGPLPPLTGSLAKRVAAVRARLEQQLGGALLADVHRLVASALAGCEEDDADAGGGSDGGSSRAEDDDEHDAQLAAAATMLRDAVGADAPAALDAVLLLVQMETDL